jgi:protease-4
MEMPLDALTQEDTETVNTIPGVAIITVEGVIGKRLGMIEQCMGGCDVDNISAQIDEAMADESVSKIVFDFNTPGGTVTGVPELAAKIAEVSKVKQTIAYVDVLCASAGYYMASQCSQVFSAPSAELGSVGVYSIYLDETRAIEDAGLKVNAISAGTYKLAGASFKPMTDDERAMFQKDVDRMYVDFKAAVTSNRSIADEDLQGQCFTGDDCITKGFSDGHVNSIGELLANLDKLAA